MNKYNTRGMKETCLNCKKKSCSLAGVGNQARINENNGCWKGDKEFCLEDEMGKYEEPINRAEIEHIVRQAHMKDYNDTSSYCNGCVERAILETIKKCKKDVKKAIKILKPKIKNRIGNTCYIAVKNEQEVFNIIDEEFNKTLGKKLTK